MTYLRNTIPRKVRLKRTNVVPKPEKRMQEQLDMLETLGTEIGHRDDVPREPMNLETNKWNLDER